MLFKFNSNILPRISLINSVIITPPYIHKKRKADEYIIYVIKKGKMYLEENNKKYFLSEGDFFVLEPEFIHNGYKTSVCEYYYIHFNHSSIYKINFSSDSDLTDFIINRRNYYLKSDSTSDLIYESDECLFPKYYHFTNYNTFTEILNTLEQAIAYNSNQLENYKALCSCSILTALIQTFRSFVLIEIERSSARIPQSYKKVHDILLFLNTEYTDKITSEKIEEIFQCNFDYINRIFKQLTKKTIFDYLNNVRINRSKELIETTSLNLRQIGDRVGISDEYYFSKVFKKYTGVSPKTYAKSISKK